MLGAAIVPVTPFQQNATLFWCKRTMAGAWVDPGGDLDRLVAAHTARGVRIEKILLTHGHIDHCGEAGRLAQRLGVPIEGPHADDAFWIALHAELGPQWGLPEAQPFTPDRWLLQGDRVMVGEVAFEVIHCPGHTPGHVVFHQPDVGIAQVGDVLFAGSIGRTDFPRGNHAQLIASITGRLWPLGDHVRFIPGHGGMSSFGAERRSNPFVSDRVLGKTA